MLSFIISVLLSLGIGVSNHVSLEEAQQLLKENNKKIIINQDGSYDIGWDDEGMD